MLSNKEMLLLFTLLKNEAISLDYAASISGYDPRYPGDLMESIGQAGIEIRCIDIEGFDAEGNPMTTSAVLLPDSEHFKVAAIIHSRIKCYLNGIDPDEVVENLKLIPYGYEVYSSLRGGALVC